MSIKLMSAVFPLPIPGSKKLVLLALCDRADDSGGSLWPSIAGIAQKASLSERQTQRMMQELVSDGVLKVIGNDAGGRGKTRQYLLLIDRFHLAAKGDNLTPFAERVTPEAEKGDMDDAERVTPVSPDSSIIHQRAISPAAVKNVNKFVEEKDPEETSNNILPYAWCSYAEAKGIPNEQIYRTWGRFRDRTEAPWPRSAWHRWVDRERVDGAVSDAYAE